VTLCAGVSGSGKSTFCLRYLVNADLAVRFCFDAEGEFAHRLDLEPATDAYSLGLALCRGWVIFDPHALFPGRMDEGFAFFCEWAFALSERIPGRKVLVVDEVWKYCSPSAIPPELALVVQTGRKRNLALMVNSQQPQKINGSILNELSEFVCFQMQFPRALEFAAAYGFDPEELRGLPALSFVARNLDSGGELRGRIRV